MAQPPPKEPPPHTIGSFRADVPEMTLDPGEERTPCYVFPLEVQGPSRIVGGAVLHAQPGLHHGNVTSRPTTGTGIRQCDPGDGDSGTDVLAGGAVLFGSSTQIQGDEWYSFPEGYGYRVREGHEIVARMHYLNAGDTPITIAPVYEWFTIDESKVVEELAPIFWQYAGFEIAPGSQLTVTGECFFGLPEHPMHVLTLLPHMHKLGRSLSAELIGGTFDGLRFLDSLGYDPENGVLAQYQPPVDFSDADGLRFSCTWQNTNDFPVFEGIGENEMCMVFGYAWPRDQAYIAVANEGGCLFFPAPSD